MKGRSHRLPQSSSAPPDDWGDGSWTVDCSCGVTFDDGEEMVSCDHCGVWVHTRCSRFVKADYADSDASFACHKCKSNTNSATNNSNNNSQTPSNPSAAEETEVAQLLVELPTKTHHSPPPPAASRLPFRLWAEVPLEDKVHVQGIPGGDPALFQNLSHSSVFTSELWRCAGYVPKKFNFQYREFPCWDDDEGGENPASRGADVLFSLSKEIMPCVPVRAFERRQVSPDGGGGKKVSLGGSRTQSWGKKDRNKIRAFGSHSSKKRKEEVGGGRDRSGKKKARGESDRVATEHKKRVSVPIVDMNKSNFFEEGDTQIAESDVPGVKNEDRKPADLPQGMHHNAPKAKHVLVIKAGKGASSDEAPRGKGSLEALVKVENVEQPEIVSAGISSKADGPSMSHREGGDVSKGSVKEEDVSKAVDGLKQPKDEKHFEGDLNGGSCNVVIDSEESRPAIDNLSMPDMQKLPVSNGASTPGSKSDKEEVKVEGGDDEAAENSKLLSCPDIDGNLQGMNHLPQHSQRSTGHSSGVLLEHETIMRSPANELKCRDADRATGVSDCDKILDSLETGFSEPMQNGHIVEESAGSSTPYESSFDVGHFSKSADIPAIPGEPNLQNSTSNVQNISVCALKASSTTPAPVSLRPSFTGSYKSPSTIPSSTAAKATHLIKQHRVKVTTTVTERKECATTVSSAEESMQDVLGQPLKGHQKGSAVTGSRSSLMSRISSTPASKHGIPDSRKQLLGHSSKASTADNKTMLPGPNEVMGPSHPQSASTQIKLVSSGSCQKNEKINQPISHPQSKLLNHPMSMHPPSSVNATSTLSDEELALLLHQELNSSPRVHRVPRIRQAIGTNLASQTATSMLSKRSSSSGGKEQVFRKKNKEDASRDGSRNETKRVGRVSSSPDRKSRQSTYMVDASSKKDARSRSPDTSTSMKKNIPGALTEGENSCPSSMEASGHSGSAARTSPRNVPDDETSPMPRTLPGLVDEIMSKIKCVTYEELCDAVRPHWHNLRKPNGERYAYSSHSHAVLDCLRNRSQWAHLIDRGPKTNSSKRRRKNDSDGAAAEESETEEITKNKTSMWDVEDGNGESHREEFPKGKRNARKRRRLELRAKGVKQARHGSNSSQGGAAVSDEDAAAAPALSQSSNDGTEGLSEDESGATGQRAMGAEESSSASGSDNSD